MNTDAPKGKVIFSKTVKIGTIPYGQRTAPLTVEIEYGNKLNPTHKPSLSFSGHYGYGNSGGWGQIIDELANIKNYAPGWNRAKVKKLRETWQKWHMNGSRADCEHQRELPEFQPKDIEITYATADWDKVYKFEKDAQADVTAQFGADVKFHHNNLVAFPVWKSDTGPDRPAGVSLATGYKFSPAIAALKALFDSGIKPFSKTAITPDQLVHASRKLLRYMAFGYTALDLVKWSKETKKTSWVYPHEHPEGYLTKPCPVCGYKYGSAWLHEDVPQDVLDWLQSL
jgi:hypothetical protein